MFDKELKIQNYIECHLLRTNSNDPEGQNSLLHMPFDVL